MESQSLQLGGGTSRRKHEGHFRSYDAYTETDVKWLGALPANWDTTKVGFVADLENGFPFSSDHFSSKRGIPLIRIRDLGKSETEACYNAQPPTEFRVDSGDIVIGMDGDFEVDRWSGEPALLNQRLCCLKPHDEIDSRFLFYSLSLPLKIINDLTHSTTVKHLSSKQVRNIKIAFPSSRQQKLIGDFLDQRTGSIDNLIAKKERLIELLEEKRTALITQAVTKGLDPDVPMKDSGVEWLGEIPEHWDVVLLDKLIDPSRPITYGIVQPGDEDPNGIPMVRGQNYSNGWDSLDQIFHVSAEVEAPYRRARLKEGDIVMTIVGAGTGNAAIVPRRLEGANITQTTARLAFDPSSCSNRFFAYLLQSKVGSANVDLAIKGAAQPGLNLNHVTKFRVLFPPLIEQERIAGSLDKETKSIDQLIEKVRAVQSVLGEYRSALITAAVTGQIDVRDHAA